MIDYHDRTTPTVLPASSAPEPSDRQPRWRWLDPASPVGSVVSAFLGSLVFWIVVDVLPYHVHVYWR